nr:hypothetical protein [Tanacetum cinerariifolium]
AVPRSYVEMHAMADLRMEQEAEKNPMYYMGGPGQEDDPLPVEVPAEVQSPCSLFASTYTISIKTLYAIFQYLIL